MLLASINIEDLVTKQICSYISKQELTFNELKTSIINKVPISPVHAKLTTLINDMQKKDVLQVQHNLEQQAYKHQMSEDKKEQECDNGQAKEDEREQIKLKKELDDIPTQVYKHEKERILLQDELARTKQTVPNVEVFHHPEQSIKKPKNKPTQDETAELIALLEKKILGHELEIRTLNERLSTVKTKLKELKNHSDELIKHKIARQFRSQARIGYDSTGEGIFEALSTKNKDQLEKNIKTQTEALGKKYNNLIRDAAQVNYPIFLEQLQKQQGKLKLSGSEIEALKTILKFMTLHLDYEHRAATINEQLTIKKRSICTQLETLKKHNQKIEEIKKTNPDLSSNNTLLTTQTNELKPVLERNNKLTKYLGNPALLLIALTTLLSIPLILTISGVIPYFIPAALLLTLFATPPALSFLATLGLGIAALVYAYKAHSTDSLIKVNQQTIGNNSNQIKRNSSEYTTIETIAIPKLEREIKKTETLRDNLEKDLKEHISFAEQYLNNAKEVEPIVQSQSSFNLKPVNSSEKMDEQLVDNVNNSDEEEEEESVEEIRTTTPTEPRL